jgi:hypothetical protein
MPQSGDHDLASAGEDDRPTILITTEERDVNDQAADALARDKQIFQRGGLLVRVVRDNHHASNGIRRPFAPRIEQLPQPILRERLSDCAVWQKEKPIGNGEVAYVPGRPPGWCVSAVHARADWPGVRCLECVIDYPVLRPDGTILATPGYDAQTGILLEPSGVLPSIPDMPTRDDARAAVAELMEVVRDFPFEAEVHKSAWLAGLLTPVARFTFQGPAPLTLVDSNVRGAGKGLLLHCQSFILTGQQFTIATYTDDVEELRKRITSIALAGERLVLLDNLDGNFGNAVLDAALTATSWKDRLLGGNRMAEVPLFATWYATGNNVSINGDTARRICHVRLESDQENPEERRDFQHPDLLGWVSDQRQRLLAAALTIVRAFFVAGKPDQQLSAWGSYEGWSSVVRACVVWAGLPDPAATRWNLQKNADTAAAAMAVLLAAWETLDRERHGFTSSEIIERIRQYTGSRATEPMPQPIADLRDTIETLTGKLDSRLLGNKLRTHRRRIFKGRFIDYISTAHGAARWAVFPARDFAAETNNTHESHQTHGPASESGDSGESFSPPSHADDNWEVEL